MDINNIGNIDNEDTIIKENNYWTKTETDLTMIKLDTDE